MKKLWRLFLRILVAILTVIIEDDWVANAA
jgi:hypothetical protein